ncbi:MAG: zinc metalloprotease, partial [Planctomycetota bacterium]
MRRTRLVSLAAALTGALLLSGDAPTTTAHAKSGPKLTKDTDVCVYAVHGSKAEAAFKAKPSNPGGGNGGGGGGGGGEDDGSSCGKTYSYWSGSTIAVWVDSSGGPSAIDSTTFESYVDHALDEWSCHSGLGEATTFTTASSASAADITIAWGDLGSTGILGQANTSYYRR